MKHFLKWAAVIGGTALGGVVVVRAIQRGRAQVKSALGRAEAVANDTRTALEHTQRALHQTREAI